MTSEAAATSNNVGKAKSEKFKTKVGKRKTRNRLPAFVTIVIGFLYHKPNVKSEIRECVIIIVV